MVLQSSGTISFTNIRTEFGTSCSSLSSLYGSALGVPTAGTIYMSNLYSKSSSSISQSSTPSTLFIDTRSTSVNSSINVAAYISTDTYGLPLTYTLTAYNSSMMSCSINSSGTMSYGFTNSTTSGGISVAITVTNRFGKYVIVNYPFNKYGQSVSLSSFGNVTLTTNTYGPIYIPSYLTDNTGSGDTYSLTYNPYNNATLVGNQLSVTGAFRNTNYSVSVQVTNGWGQVSTGSVNITEPASITLYTLPSQTISNNQIAINIASYFSSPYGYTVLSYTAYSSYSNVQISGTTLYITGAYRGFSYNVNVTITSSYNNQQISTTCYVTESGYLTAYNINNGQNWTLNSNYSFTLSNYFTNPSNGGTINYYITGNPKSNASISNGVLTITYAGRNTTYTIQIQGTNTLGQTANTLINILEPGDISYTQIPTQIFGGYYSTWYVYLTNYFTSISNNNTSFAINDYGGQGNVTMINSNTVQINGMNRGLSYNIEVSMSSAYSSAVAQYFTVQESGWPTMNCANISGIYTSYPQAPTNIGSGGNGGYSAQYRSNGTAIHNIYLGMNTANGVGDVNIATPGPTYSINAINYNTIGCTFYGGTAQWDSSGFLYWNGGTFNGQYWLWIRAWNG